MKSGLLYSFLRYIESTRHLVLYRLDSSHPIHLTFVMPHVKNITLIDCEPDMISRILDHLYFPSLQNINYLSLPPSDPLIHQRFTHNKFIRWTFPTLSMPYLFYDCMTEAGYGKKENGLVSQYLVSHYRCSSNKPNYDLYLPHHGIVTGKFYRDQQLAFFQKKQCDAYGISSSHIISNDTPFSEAVPLRLRTHAVYDSRWIYQQEFLHHSFEKNILNLPDAIPFHNSNK